MGFSRLKTSLLVANIAYLLLTGPAGAAEMAPPPAPTADTGAHRGAVFVDPLGFLLFGPTLGAELGFSQYSVVAYGRWLDGGLLARALFQSDTDKFAFSPGAGLKGRYYLTERLVGAHVGVAIELLKTRTENHADLVATNNLVLVPEAEVGYRHTYGSLFIGGTLGLGYVLQVASSVQNIEGGTGAGSFEAKDYSTLYGSANLDFGLLF